MILERLSTPVAYLSSMRTRDPFLIRARYSASTAQNMDSASPVSVGPNEAMAIRNCYYYQSWNSEQRYAIGSSGSTAGLTSSTAWILASARPDGAYYNISGVLATDGADQLPYTIRMLYDPTNGATSRGSLWRTGGSAPRTPGYAAGEGLVLAIGNGR